MKKSITVLFLIMGLLSFGQSAGKFSLGISTGINKSDHFLSRRYGDVPEEVIAIIQETETPGIGYTGYLFSEYAPSKRIQFRIGAGYSQEGYRTKKNIGKLIFEVPEPDAPEFIWFEYLHRDIIIPVQVKFLVWDPKPALYFIVGAAPSFVLRGEKKIKIKYESGRKQVKTEGLTNYRGKNLELAAGLGLEFRLNHRLRIFIQPECNLNIFDTYKPAPLNWQQYSFQLSTGIRAGSFKKKT